MAEDFEQQFAHVRAFGWDDEKRDRVLRERNIDFEELRRLFEEPTYARS